MAVERIVTKFSPKGKRIKDIYKMTSDFSASKGGKGEITIPFCNYLYWNIHEDKIFVRENTDGIVHIFDNDGNLIKDIPSPFPMEKVTKKDLDTWKKGWKEIVDKEWYQRFGKVIDKYKKSIHEFKPNLDGMYLTPEENILVSGTEGEDYSNYWLLDKKGQILVQGRTNSAGLYITPNFLFYGSRDEDGGYQFFAQKRTDSEMQDLKKFLVMK